MTIDAGGASTLRDLGRPSPTRGEEPFTGLRDRVEIAAAMVRPEIIDAARLADGRVAALLDDGGKASLGIAARLLDGASWPDAIVLATKGSRSVAWPKGLLWSKKAPRSRARKMSAKRGELCLRAAAGAIAVTCQYTGIAAIFRDGSATPTLLRLPMGPGVRLHAVPTALGVLITVATDDGAGAVIHVDDDGTILGQRAVYAPLPALPTADRRAVLFVGDEAGGSGRLHLLRLPDLAAEGPSVHIGFPAKSLALAENGRIALADPERLVRGILGEDGLTLGAVEDLVTLIAASGEGGQALSASPELAAPTRGAEARLPAVKPEPAARAEPETRTPADAGVEAAGADEAPRGSQDARADAASEPDDAPAVGSDSAEDEVPAEPATAATSSAEAEAGLAASSGETAPRGDTSEPTSAAASGAGDEDHPSTSPEMEPRVSEEADEAPAPEADATADAEVQADDDGATERGSPATAVAQADADAQADVSIQPQASPLADTTQSVGRLEDSNVRATAGDADAIDTSKSEAEAVADDNTGASADAASERAVEAAVDERAVADADARGETAPERDAEAAVDEPPGEAADEAASEPSAESPAGVHLVADNSAGNGAAPEDDAEATAAERPGDVAIELDVEAPSDNDNASDNDTRPEGDGASDAEAAAAERPVEPASEPDDAAPPGDSHDEAAGAPEVEADAPDADAETSPTADDSERAPPAPSGPYAPSLATDAPSFGLALGGTPAGGWLGTVGKEFELTLRIRSTGRASRGIRLAAGGEALARGLVQLVAIVGDGTRVPFGPSEAGMRRADLPAMAIPSGVLHPFAPNPATDAARAAAESALAASHVEIRVVARGIRPGGALLTLSVSALGSSAPPLRRIRPLNIR